MTLIKKLALIVVLLNVLVFGITVLIYPDDIYLFYNGVSMEDNINKPFWQSVIQLFQFSFIIFFLICKYIYFQIQEWYGFLEER